MSSLYFADVGLGKTLQTRRKPVMSQVQLAERMGVSQSLISQWETDQTVPTADQLARVAFHLETTVEDLVVGADPKYDKWRRDAVVIHFAGHGTYDPKAVPVAVLERRVIELRAEVKAQAAHLREARKIADHLRRLLDQAERKP